MSIHLSGWQFVDLRTFIYLILTGWCKWRSVQRWRRFWCGPSVSVRWRWTCSFAPPTCLPILWGAIFAREASVPVVITKHSQVSFYHILHHSIPRKLNSPLLLFSDFGTGCLDHLLHILHCSPETPSFGHFGHIQCHSHVGLFQLYPTCLPCHCSRHFENVQEISCCV